MKGETSDLHDVLLLVDVDVLFLGDVRVLDNSDSTCI